MRIVSFNVHYFTDKEENDSFTSLLQDIALLSPDVLCLQEVLFTSQVSKLKSIFPYFVENIPAKWKGYGFGNLILSKIPISDSFSKTLFKGTSKVKRGYCGAKIGDIWIVTLHLDVFDENIPGQKEKTLVRHIQVEEILSQLPDKCILCGDFNSLLDSDYSQEKLKEIVKIDLKRKVVTDFKTIPRVLEAGFERVGGIPEKTVWSDRVVDFFFARGVEVERGGVMETESSDHYPIYIDL